MMLAGVIEGVMCQRLLPRVRGGRVAAIEILVGTDAIRNMIREGKTHQIPAFMDAGSKYGMQTMDKALVELYRRNQVTKDVALQNAKKLDEVKRQILGSGLTPLAGVESRSGSGTRPPARI